MKTQDYFDENGWFKDEFLWPLRKQIVLGSIYVSDYNNSFGIKPEQVCEFFTSFWDSYCEELAKEDGLYEKAKKLYDSQPQIKPLKYQHVNDAYLELSHQYYDNEGTLKKWYDCYDVCPLPPTVINVDIHWDFARSISVIAASEDEAISVVEDMMKEGVIPRHTFEPTEDYELDTDWQPDD